MVGRWVRAAKAYEAAQGRDRLVQLEQLHAELELERAEILEELAGWHTQAELARILGTTQQAVSKRLSRPRPPAGG